MSLCNVPWPCFLTFPNQVWNRRPLSTFFAEGARKTRCRAIFRLPRQLVAGRHCSPLVREFKRDRGTKPSIVHLLAAEDFLLRNSGHRYGRPTHFRVFACSSRALLSFSPRYVKEDPRSVEILELMAGLGKSPSFSIERGIPDGSRRIEPTRSRVSPFSTFTPAPLERAIEKQSHYPAFWRA